MKRPAQVLAAAAALALAACVEVTRESGASPSTRTESLARGTVGPDSGLELVVTSEGAFAGVGISIPPGAVADEVEIEIVGRFGDPRLPSIVQTVEFRPADLLLRAEALVTLRYSSVYAATAGRVWDEAEMRCYAFAAGPTLDERAIPVVDREPERDLLRVSTDRLGTFYGAHAPLRTLISQPTRLIDPAEPLAAELVAGQLELSATGSAAVQIGKGSLGSFRTSPAPRNVLVVPGLLTDPLLTTAPSGLLPPNPFGGLKRDFDNAVVYQYPSGQSLRTSANALYDLLTEGAGPGFGCRIVAHGSGGLVVRYAIERAHLDPGRPGYRPGQPGLDTLVDAVVLLATPHQGAAVVESRFDFLLSAVFEADLRFVEGVVDLLPRNGSFVDRLNDGWIRPHAAYFAIAGDVDGRSSDGLVDVDSAVGLPGTVSRPARHQVFSGPIYEHGALLLFADPIGVLGQTRQWLGKSTGNAPPIAGDVGTPTSVVDHEVEIPLSLSDQEGATCFVIALISVDGSDWRIATPAAGAGVPARFPAAPAPGLEQVFRWDSAADRVGLFRPQNVVVRFVLTDGVQQGTAGQSGSFVVDNRPSGR
jgi:hypothetical protein